VRWFNNSRKGQGCIVKVPRPQSDNAIEEEVSIIIIGRQFGMQLDLLSQSWLEQQSFKSRGDHHGRGFQA